MTTLALDEIERRREFNYRRTPERRVRTIEDARAFVEEVGFCHFWPIKGIEMPNLFHAIAGRVRPVPNEHNDPDGSKCWGWKDLALDKRWWYYGKFLRHLASQAGQDGLAPLDAPADAAYADDRGAVHAPLPIPGLADIEVVGRPVARDSRDAHDGNCLATQQRMAAEGGESTEEVHGRYSRKVNK